MADAAVQDVPVELGLELGAVVGLDLFDVERELLEHMVEELDRGELVVLRVDPQHSQAGAVVDRRVLVVLLGASSGDRCTLVPNVTIKTRPERVLILDRMDVPMVFKRSTGRLTDDQVAAVYDVARRASTWQASA